MSTLDALAIASLTKLGEVDVETHSPTPLSTTMKPSFSMHQPVAVKMTNNHVGIQRAQSMPMR